MNFIQHISPVNYKWYVAECGIYFQFPIFLLLLVLINLLHVLNLVLSNRNTLTLSKSKRQTMLSLKVPPLCHSHPVLLPEGKQCYQLQWFYAYAIWSFLFYTNNSTLYSILPLAFPPDSLFWKSFHINT